MNIASYKSKTCINQILSKPENDHKGLLQIMFLTCLNRAPVYTEKKEHSVGSELGSFRFH